MDEINDKEIRKKKGHIEERVDADRERDGQTHEPTEERNGRRTG